jgi:nuclease HARBI1
MLALRFYATGAFQLVVGDLAGVSKSTVCTTVNRVTRAITRLSPKYIVFPESEQQRRDVMQQFYLQSKLPGVIGAVDGTHIPIQSPGGTDAEIYRNRKGYFSINTQLVCDNTGYITDIVCRWPGSCHDSFIFDNSLIRAKLETSPLNGYLIGDSGYACRRYLLTPVSNPKTPQEIRFNNSHISARNAIERTNGILKRRFPCLKYCLRLKVENILPVIVACTVLHNIATTLGVELPPDDADLETFMTATRQQRYEDDDDTDALVTPASSLGPAAASMRQAVIDSHFK